MTRRLLVALLGLTVAAALALPVAARASHDPSGAPLGEDFAVGSYLNQTSLFRVAFDFSAHSGPRGESPSGEFAFELEIADDPGPGIAIRGSVTCLRVEGNRATLGLALTEPAGRMAAIVGLSDDPGTTPGSQGPDALYLRYVETVPGPDDCPTPVDPRSLQQVDLLVITDERGGITVHDAGPTSKEQCKLGGWRSFPGFRNQGECVSSVAAA